RLQMYSMDGKLVYAGPTTSTKTKYIYLHNHVIAEVGGAGTQYIHTDVLGSPVARTNTIKGIISRTRYEPYGRTAMGAEPTIGFTGHWNDLETGLTYMQQRYYDPVAGRMLSIDPVTTDTNTGGGFNRYVYANNSPYKYIDPDGRQAADRFVEQHRKDLATGNGKVYEPLQPIAVGVTAGMMVIPVAIAVASGSTAIAASGVALKIAGVAGKVEGPVAKELS
ncbi:MAG: RHS repeat-associated core domain-containing protein, partial [Telluria sp.]